MAEFIIVFGFFLVLIIEQVVLDCKERWLTNESKAKIHINNSGHNEPNIIPNSHDEIDETSRLIANPNETLSTAVARKNLLKVNNTLRRKSSGEGSSRMSYGSTIDTSSTSKSCQQIESHLKESIQQNGESSS